MDNDDRPPRGPLFILDADDPEETRPGELDNLRFEKTVCDLFSQGLCVMPKNKWVN